MSSIHFEGPLLDTGRTPGYAKRVIQGPSHAVNACVISLLASMWAVPARAQTLGQLAGGEECTTVGSEGISAQLARFHECEFAAGFARVGNHPSIELASVRTYDLATPETRAAIVAAAEKVPLRVSVVYRPVSEQFVLYKTPACTIYDEPGSDIHQSGKAVDVQNWEEATSAMISAGCTQPAAATLPLHFECPGPDMRENAVLVFQRLWNINRPSDQITEDGIYGPQTEGRLAMTPASGFSNPGCDALTSDAGLSPPDAGLSPPDAGMEGPVFEDDGCNCRANSSSNEGGWVFSTLAFGLLLRRRRT